MPDIIPNITKDKTRMLKGVTDVYIRDDAWAGSTGWAGSLLIPKSGVAVEMKPRLSELVDGSKLLLGYDCSVTIETFQYFSLFEIQKLVNKVCTIMLKGMDTYIMSVLLNLEVTATPGDDKSSIKLTGNKYVEADRIIEFLNPSPWGSWSDFWALPGNPTSLPSEGIPAATEFSYAYKLRTNEPLVKYIMPGAPTAEDDITEIKLTLVDRNLDPIEREPSNVVLTKTTGTGTVTIADTKYEIILETGLYKLYFTDATGGEAHLGETLTVSFDL